MVKDNENKWAWCDGKEIVPRKAIEKYFAFYNQNVLYSVLWTSEKLSFKKAIEKVKENLLVDKVVECPENVCEIEK